MPREWIELTRMTQGKPITVERVRLAESEIAIEGSFSLPPLANLPAEDQVFVMAFMRCHGSIKDMEKMFGISYPTVKNRINRIAGQLEFVEEVKISPQQEIIGELERGEISAEEAIRRLS
ncbi:MAG: RNA polymerase subunit sigma-70 [Chloroflexi bacterium RBG_16_56_11]|nr:MAG: RNA polymerase subunit sigma-70 [Chloroflexi bacterium RBG_16_56_11]